MDRPAWPLGLYCERTALGFSAEPLNTWSNLAFLAAAFLAWREWKAAGGEDRGSLFLILVLTAIGCGSFAFHAAPSRTTVLMDVIPIQVFVLSALFFALRRYLGAPPWIAAASVAAFFAGSGWIVGVVGSGALRGGAGYLPPLAAMPAIAGLILWRRERLACAGDGGDGSRHKLGAAARGLLAAAAVFAVSLTLRTLDQPFCPSIPTGLHFLWHLCNALVLFLLVSTQLRFRLESTRGA